MKKIAFILFFILTQTGFAQDVEFTVKPNRTKIGLNEEVQIKFLMNVIPESFKAPFFRGFIMKTENPGIKTERKFSNGVESAEQVYTYRLQPREKGTLYIESATIRKGGKEYKTESFEITVTDSVKSPNQSDVELYLIAEPNRTEVYEGELFTVGYKLLSDREITVNRYVRDNKDGDFTDFQGYKQKYRYSEIEETKKGKKVYKGKKYETVEIQRYYLSPVKSGNITLPPLELNIELLAYNGEENKFGKEYDKVTQKVKAVNSVKIKSKPLPEKRRQESFNGLVGRYNFSQKVSKTHLKLEETFDIEMIIEGVGNQLALPMPKPNLSEGLEIIKTKKEDIVILNDNPEYLFKVIYTIKPKYTGEHSVNKITYAYFNPVIEEYIYDTKNEQTITVIE